MTYSHRNGETEPPTEPGLFWLDGTQLFGGVFWGKYQSFVDVHRIAPSGRLLIELNGLDVYRGRWWGPWEPWNEQEAAHEAQPDRWIPVTERLPDPYSNSLLLYGSGRYVVGYTDLGGDTWWHSDHLDGYRDPREKSLIGVTHWRQLPAPPPQEEA